MPQPRSGIAPGAFRVVVEKDGFAVLTGDKALKTPAGIPVLVPTLQLADTIAAERAAGSGPMPMYKFAATALDRVGPGREKVEAELLRYTATDLLCYRAEREDQLIARQNACWNPILSWAAQTLGANLAVTAGISPLPEQPEARLAFKQALANESPFALTAIHICAALTGSLVLALALRHGHCNLETAWHAATLEERWQREKWGEDEEAAKRAATLRLALSEAVRFLKLATE